MKLVLIEAYAKLESISKYLGKGFKVLATGGHIRDLPEHKLGVDVADRFKPDYVIMSSKKKAVDSLRLESKKAEEIYLATDPDREGEAISWHLANILNIDPKKANRIVYNEISAKAVKKAIENPRPINLNLVDAYQARRVLDRLVGYKLSPLLSRKIKGKGSLSGGRVQSATLKLIVDRDREIENFKPEEYWNLSALLSHPKEKGEFKAVLALPKNKKLSSEADTKKVLVNLEGAKYIVESVKKSITKGRPGAPFTTDTMLKDAFNKLGMATATTSMTAQGLYEGVSIQGEGKIALVTYIRTDSTRVSPDAQADAKDYIINKYGVKFAPEKYNFYASKKDTQDAHEAIRPIDLSRTPESLKGKITPNHYKLYKLIYERFLASQMTDAEYNFLSADIAANAYKFRCTGKTLLFAGYTAVYSNEKDEKEDETGENAKLPPLEKGDELNLIKLIPEQKFTKPPARFNDGSITAAMKEAGIGRPATYAQTAAILLKRLYIEKEGKHLISTTLGRTVVDLLIKFFPEIMNVHFTAEMEEKLDDIEDGDKEWQKIISEFYVIFEKELKEALGDDSYIVEKIPDEPSDVKCEKCGTMMVVKMGRYGKFLACPNYPTCKNIKSINETVAKCPKCEGDVVKKRTKTGKTFFGCSNYPTCDFSTWDTPTKQVCECGAPIFKNFWKGKTTLKCIKCGKETVQTKSANESNDTTEAKESND